MWCALGNHNYMYHISTNVFLDSNCNEAVVYIHYHFVTKFPQI